MTSKLRLGSFPSVIPDHLRTVLDYARRPYKCNGFCDSPRLTLACTAVNFSAIFTFSNIKCDTLIIFLYWYLYINPMTRIPWELHNGSLPRLWTIWGFMGKWMPCCLNGRNTNGWRTEHCVFMVGCISWNWCVQSLWWVLWWQHKLCTNHPNSRHIWQF